MSVPETSPASEPPVVRARGFAARVGLGLFGRIAGTALRALGATWRVEVLGADPREGSSHEAQLAALKSDNLSRRAQIEDLTQRACVLLATARLEIKRKEEQLEAVQNKRRHGR